MQRGRFYRYAKGTRVLLTGAIAIVISMKILQSDFELSRAAVDVAELVTTSALQKNLYA